MASKQIMIKKKKKSIKEINQKSPKKKKCKMATEM